MFTALYVGSRKRGKRYVRALLPGVQYAYCIQCANDPRYDAEQGVCDAADVPERLQKAADARYGHFPSYVEWPDASIP